MGRRNTEKSHIAKHQVMEHAGEEPTFIFKVISNHRTALNRQIREGVRIRRRGGAGQILNSRAEFNRCHIPRLVVEEEDTDTKQKRKEVERLEKEELLINLEEMDRDWEQLKDKNREQAERKRQRPGELVENDGGEEDQMGGAKKKRRRYAKLKEDWGENEGSEDESSQEDCQEDTVVYVPTTMSPPIPSSRGTKMTSITDYFPVLRIHKSEVRIQPTRKNKRKRMDSDMSALWVDADEGMTWFEDQTAICADQTNPRRIQRMRMEDQHEEQRL